MQDSLFDNHSDHNQPLAYKQRPQSFEGFYGQDHAKDILEKYSPKTCPHFVFWGPPGSGKTTAALILKNHLSLELISFNAVLGGIKDLKEKIQEIEERKKLYQKKAILFIDEIHRIHKAAQDALLPYLEKGSFILLGATTENPQIVLNKAVLSRIHLIQFQKHKELGLKKILKEANKEHGLSEEILDLVVSFSNGDARFALNKFERILDTEEKDLLHIKNLLAQESRHFDRKGSRHYDVISAFIKSIRGSDVDAAIMWLAVMLDGGEDPVFIARRLMILASEDIGNADPRALSISTDSHYAVKHLGMPEARITLAQAVVYLARAPKSNSAYLAINKALEYVKRNPTEAVPTHLRNHHPDKKYYKYPHNEENHWVEQVYKKNNEIFFESTGLGYEKLQDDFESKIKQS